VAPGALQFQAKLDEVVIFPATPTRTTAFAGCQGTITSVTQGPASLVGQFVIASAADSGMPAGTSDEFALNSITPVSVSTCETPVGFHPIDQGNIVTKVTPWRRAPRQKRDLRKRPNGVASIAAQRLS